MKLQERSYAGKGRPLPNYELDENAKLLTICIPWGPRSRTKATMTAFKEQFLSGRVDPEMTMPFDRLTCLSPMANDLRIAMKVTNDHIYYADNRNEYTYGVEFQALCLQDKELAIANVGGPSVIFHKRGAAPVLLNSTLDMAYEYSMTSNLYPSLPAELLGVESTSSVAVRSLHISKGDRIVLLARPYLPTKLFSLIEQRQNLDQIGNSLTQDNPDLSFWIANVEF